ncbi:hypothetical protein F5X68DRAFT_230461 [Plectosphaerella plurivora]|uniref:Uncharacterized protein n=2 Tax=Plectosphaerella TaxID=40657 RepID=A0A9P8VG74_9PEZI|nr:hypothetical protein F5X68DRAFT_230461 [Plectosphaerella plurivora]KAH7354491.1 hypothetical protein B0T11DRAFT_301471 [Plectosphaerella cucumerina]
MFSKIIVSVLLASSAVLAAPAAEVDSRQLIQAVKICSNKDFNDCDTINFTFGFCVQNVGRLNDKVSSLDSQGYNCIYYNDTGCRTGGGQIATRGPIANIRTDTSHSTMNDDVSSFLCNI